MDAKISRPTRQCDEREPADSHRDKSNVTGGWLPSLTSAFGNMKRLGTMERVGLIMAAVFIAFGVYLVVHPTEGYVSHSSSSWPPHSVIEISLEE